MKTCYTCGKHSTDTICDSCQKVYGVSMDDDATTEFDEAPITQPMFDLSDFEESDFAAGEDGACIATDRWQLLEALYDECRTIRENLTGQGGVYAIKDRDLTDFFVILDSLENL